MPRTLTDAKLDTRAARKKLKRRREPYWRSLSPGLAIGYRRLGSGGTWIARHYTPATKRRFKALGTTDDVAEANGSDVLNFTQAQHAAHKWFEALTKQDRRGSDGGPYTIGNALDDYLAEYAREGGKAKNRMLWSINAHIRPDLGKVQLTHITTDQIKRWLARIAEAAPRRRTQTGKRQKFGERDTTPDGARRRRASANRILTILKAALNRAVENKHAGDPETWRAVKPYREVNAPKIRYLSDDDTRRLVNACPPAFRTLVTAALLTGARYSELAALKVGDFNTDSSTLTISRSKTGRERHIHLTDEGTEFFTQRSAGKGASNLLLPRGDGIAWGHAHQARPIAEACKVAKISPAIGFHILRHTYASRLAMKGVPMPVIAAQLGHADTRMTERHYAHLAPSYVGDTVRAAFGKLDIVPPSNVQKLMRS